MTMLTHMAISLAVELGIHRDAPMSVPRRIISGRIVVEQTQVREERTLEQRRTMLALFHLTSS